MVALISLLLVVVLSMIIVRVASVALTLTGLSRELARFQARSAFTGSGFTTTESEKVVQHPVRRRIIMLLMLLGNAGIITAVTSLILSFVNLKQAEGVTSSLWFRGAMLALGLSLLWTLANSRWIDRRLQRVIAWALKRWSRMEVRDYAGLLHLTGGYVVVEMAVEQEDWLADRELKDLKLSDEGVLVLGVERSDGSYLGAPRGHTRLHADDTILLYGPQDILADLDERRAGWAGNRDHEKAVEKQRLAEAQEKKRDEQAEAPRPSQSE